MGVNSVQPHRLVHPVVENVSGGGQLDSDGRRENFDEDSDEQEVRYENDIQLIFVSPPTATPAGCYPAVDLSWAGTNVSFRVVACFPCHGALVGGFEELGASFECIPNILCLADRWLLPHRFLVRHVPRRRLASCQTRTT